MMSLSSFEISHKTEKNEMYLPSDKLPLQDSWLSQYSVQTQVDIQWSLLPRRTWGVFHQKLASITISEAVAFTIDILMELGHLCWNYNKRRKL